MRIQPKRRAQSGRLEPIEVFAVAAILALFLLLFCLHYHKETVDMPKAYQAWVKQTGNPKELTYEEWRRLLRATEKSPNVIFIPMPQ